MCGIAGVFRLGGSPRREDEEVVRAMLDRLRHRGPDGDGLVHRDGLTLGHTRLAVVDLSEAAAQPMASRDGRLLLSYNGEIYNAAELRDELGLAPRDLRSTSDTEILLEAWMRWGTAALDRFVGQWAFALHDREGRNLLLARDRFGEKPLFWHEADGVLSFASSMEALFQAPWVGRELDGDALVEYLAMRYVMAPRTVVSGVRKLPPGSLLEASGGGVRVRRWYDPRFRRPAGPRRGAEAVEEFGHRLTQAVRRCTVSDVPVALLLSEGVDSRCLRAALELAGCRVPCYTYRPATGAGGPGAPRTAEADGDGAVSLLIPPEERLARMREVLAGLTEPVGDGAALATWFLIREARHRATVFLCGHGADEVLGGYRLSQDRFRLGVLARLGWVPGRWSNRPFEIYTNGAEPALARRPTLLATPARLVPAAARYLIHRPLPAAQVRELLREERLAEPYLATVDGLYAECSESAAGLDRIQEVLVRTFLSHCILSWADSVSMASSAELRLPYLDRDLVEFVLGLPPWMRVAPLPGRRNTKRILRWWGERYLPRESYTARKRSFHYGTLREMLPAHGDEIRGRILASDAVRGAMPGLEGWLAHPPAFFHGPREEALWSVLTLSLWSQARGVRWNAEAGSRASASLVGSR